MMKQKHTKEKERETKTEWEKWTETKLLRLGESKDGVKNMK